MNAEYSRRGLKCFKGRFFNFPIMCLDVSFNKFQGVIAFSCELVNVFGP